jgi:hypothetical protein
MPLSLSAANAIVTLSIPLLFPIPQQLQGFATDDVFNTGQIKSVETLSGGFVFTEVVQNYVLQGDSLSNRFFDVWWTSMQAAQDVYWANGSILLPAVGTKFAMVRGALTGYQPLPDAKKILQPRTHAITWNRVAPSPV